MKNKLVVIINSLKVSKIKKILLYERKFLVQNYSCLQNPCLEGYRPQIPVLSVLCPQLNLLNPQPNKIPGYATGCTEHCSVVNASCCAKNSLECFFSRVHSVVYRTSYNKTVSLGWEIDNWKLLHAPSDQHPYTFIAVTHIYLLFKPIAHVIVITHFALVLV